MMARREKRWIRNLDTDNSNKIAKQLDAEADKIKKDQAEDIKQKIIVKFNINQEGAGDKSIHLGSSVEKLLNFLDKGGEVDAWIPDDDTADEDIEYEEQPLQLRADIRETFDEIRQLEGKLRLLEHTSNDNE